MNLDKKYETYFYPKIKKPIDEIFDMVTSIIKSQGHQAAIAYINKQLTLEGLAKEVKILHSNVGVRQANVITRSLKQDERKSFILYIETKEGGSFGLNYQWINWITNYLRNHLIQNITFKVAETTKDFLLNVLNKSISEGLGIDETVRLLNDSGFSAMQAARIVRTEVNMASNAGTLAAGETYDWQMQKKWIAVHDNRTRGVNPKDHASHIGLDGTVIDFEDQFIDPRNGDRLQSPGDPKASAESVINCRCQMSLKPKRDSRGRLIPKRQSTVVIYPSRQRRQQIVTI
jgi:hypothetical protein